MNQILITNDEKGHSTREIRPIIRFFAIAIIIISLIFIGEGVYNLSNSLKNNESFSKPILNVEKNGSTVDLKVASDIGINKIEYSWNGGSTTVLKCEGKKNINSEIEMPQGDNKLDIVIIDVEGHKTKFKNIEVSFTDADDVTKPKISIVNGIGKISITATDETELDCLTYQWEGEEEVKVQAIDENNKTITQDISIQKGTKKIIINAVDKTGNKETISKKIVGSNGPEIKVSIADGNFVVKVTDEYVITKIEYTLNEEVFTVEGIPQGAKEYEFKVQLKDGTNYLKINAYENELMTEYKCKKTK